MAARYKVLVVDDDINLCQIIVDTLKDNGYEAAFVQNTEEGYERATSNPPDLILCDVEIPQVGGFVLCQKFRAHPATKDVPVILLSVRDSDFDRKTALSLGANQYLTKPFRRSALLNEVKTLLAARSAEWIEPSSNQQRIEVPIPSVQTSPDAKHAPPIPPTPKPAPPLKAPTPSAPSIPAQPKLTVPMSSAPPPSAPPPPAVPKTAGPTPSASTGVQVKTFESFSGKSSYSSVKLIKEWFLKNKKVSVGIASVLLIGLVWGSYLFYKGGGSKGKSGEDAGGAEAGEVSVNVMQVAPAPFQDILSAVGTIAGGSEIELRFQTEGNLRSLNYREGDSVHSGAVIAQLDQTQVLIKLERAKSEYYRYEKLYALGGVSKDRLDEAKVQLDFAQSEMAKTVLRASQDGIFGDKGVEVGEFVTPQKKVGTLVSLNTVLVRIGVIEKEIDKIFPGQVVTATVDTYPNVEFKGKVENISPLVQGQSKTLMVEARIPNTGKLLLPGMFARTKIIIYEKDNVIAVPNDALEKTAEGYQIYVVGKESVAEVRPVQVSYVSLTHSVVSNGLSAGEQVVIQRPQELKSGSKLKVIEVEKPVTKAEESAMGAEHPADAQGFEEPH